MSVKILGKAGAPGGGQGRNALCACGSGEKYKRCCGAVGAPAPSLPASLLHFQRGVALLRSGQAGAALQALMAAVMADAAYFEAHHLLGATLLQAGRPADATGFLSRAVALQPSSAMAQADLGTAFDRQNLHDQAIDAYRKAVALSPKLGEIHHRLGELYALYSRVEEAAACFEQAADAKPNTTQARLCRSDAHLLRGEWEGAENWARRAIALEPASAAAHGTLGGLLYAQGRFAEAEACFETALRRDPRSSLCWDGLVHCRRYAPGDGAIIERLRAVLQRGDVPEADRMTIHFALGKVLDDAGDYAAAMEQFDAGNQRRGKGLMFDRAGLAAAVERNIQLFTPEFMARHNDAATQDERPLFIVGMFRSGTTLVEQIVSSHPEIAAGGELTVWAPTDIDTDPAADSFDPARTRLAMAKYLAVLEKIGPTAARVTDKLPFNFLRLGAIHALMPQARIIHCRRNPIDTCLSIYTTLFKAGVPFAARKADLAFCYRHYLRMMDHWRRVLPPARFLEVEYERLIAEREAETRRLIAFTGLGWDVTCLHPELNLRAIGTSSAWQVRQPVYASSQQRWRRYEPWLGELGQLQGD